MDLMTASDWGTFRSAIKDLRDTFFDLPITIIFRNEAGLTNFSDSKKDNRSAVPIAFTGLNVPKNTDNDSQSNQRKDGFMDESEGYCLFHYPDLLASTPPLIVGGQVQVKVNRDTMKFNSEEVAIIGVDLVGPTEQDYQLVKVHYKHIMNPQV